MRKRILFFLMGLLLIPIVYGQEILIGDRNLSLIVLIPLIFIVFIGIIFLTIFLKDMFKGSTKEKIKEETKEETKEERGITVEKTEKEEAKEEDEKIESLARSLDYLNIINRFQLSLEKRTDMDNAFDELMRIMRAFFKERFNLNYQFTYDELEKEFKRRKIKNKLLKDLPNFLYSGRKISRYELNKITIELEKLFKKIIEESEIRFLEKQGVIEGFNHKEEKLDEKINEIINRIKYSKVANPFLPNYKSEARVKMSIYINTGLDALRKEDIEEVKKVYKAACNLFDKMKEEDKRLCYLEILEFYERISDKILSFGKEPDKIKKEK